jgi:hypothetical protein
VQLFFEDQQPVLLAPLSDLVPDRANCWNFAKHRVFTKFFDEHCVDVLAQFYSRPILAIRIADAQFPGTLPNLAILTLGGSAARPSARSFAFRKRYNLF